MLMMSEFKELQKELYICKSCGKGVSKMIFQTMGNVFLYQKGYTARKEFDKLEYCPTCFVEKNIELMQLHEGEEAVVRYFAEKRQEEYDAMSEEQKKEYDDKVLWKQIQNERTDKIILHESKKEEGLRHQLDKYTYVSDYFLSCIIIDALETSSGYWGRIVDYKRPHNLILRVDEKTIFPHVDYVMNEGGSITLWAFEEDDVEEDPDTGIEQYSEDCLYELTLEKMVIGYGKALEYWNSPNIDDYKFKCLRDQNDCDGELADCVLQFALFGELVYG